MWVVFTRCTIRSLVFFTIYFRVVVFVWVSLIWSSVASRCGVRVVRSVSVFCLVRSSTACGFIIAASILFSLIFRRWTYSAVAFSSCVRCFSVILLRCSISSVSVCFSTGLSSTSSTVFMILIACVLVSLRVGGFVIFGNLLFFVFVGSRFFLIIIDSGRSGSSRLFRRGVGV